MRRTVRTAVFILAFAAVLPSAQAKAPVPEDLAPISPWHIDWAPDSCTLRRRFGSSDDFILFQLERFAPTDVFQLVLSGKRLRGLAPPRKLEITYGTGGFVHDVESYRTGALQDGTPSIFVTVSSLAPFSNETIAQPAVAPATEAAIIQIAIRRSNREFVLKTGSLGKAFEQMRKCTDQLVESWGLNLAEQKSIVRRPIPTESPGHWLRSTDYPQKALSLGQQSLINFRLIVGIDGIPTACSVQRSYSGKPFDELTCRLLQRRARFQPSVDASGKPVASYYLNSVAWLAGP